MADKTTIEFVPKRLNAAPVVFRGMTGREVVLMGVAGLAAGVLPGLIGFWVVGALPLVPTAMAATAGLALWFGGTVMRRLRRGRPETWLYRRIQWTAAAVLGYNSADLIVTTAVYRPGRGRRGISQGSRSEDAS